MAVDLDRACPGPVDEVVEVVALHGRDVELEPAAVVVPVGGEGDLVHVGHHHPVLPGLVGTPEIGGKSKLVFYTQRFHSGAYNNEWTL